mmetsp:Transcript_75845/g.126291  ORF Transcript_75845/g.126291 Transcript_75845/m.126291 type:complete len:141 (-) Transcript_75845:588-1010(-)
MHFKPDIMVPGIGVEHCRRPYGGGAKGQKQHLSAAMSLCREQAHLLRSAGVQAEEACRWQHLSQVHAVTLTALWRTTLSDLHPVRWSAGNIGDTGDTARHAKWRTSGTAWKDNRYWRSPPTSRTWGSHSKTCALFFLIGL